MLLSVLLLACCRAGEKDAKAVRWIPKLEVNCEECIDYDTYVTEIRQRNVADLLVNSKDMVLYNGYVCEVDLVKERAQEFWGNPTNAPDLPERMYVDIDLLGQWAVSKGVIYFDYDEAASPALVDTVLSQLAWGVYELRDELSHSLFSSAYVDLEVEHAQAIDEAIPVGLLDMKSLCFYRLTMVASDTESGQEENLTPQLKP